MLEADGVAKKNLKKKKKKKNKWLSSFGRGVTEYFRMATEADCGMALHGGLELPDAV